MRRTVTCLLLLAALVFAGCGEDEASALETVRASAAATSSESSKIVMTMSGLPGMPDGGSTIEGGFDWGQRRGRFVMDPSQLGAAQLGDEITAIFDYSDGFVMWMRIPALAAQLGRDWMKVDIGTIVDQGIGPDMGVDFEALLSQQERSDPSSGVEMLRGASSVEEVGDEDVRGEPTTHYRAVIDLQRSIDEAPESARAALQSLKKRYTVEELPVEVWLDDEGRVRRFAQTVAPGALILPEGVPALTEPYTVTMELYDFGSKVDATPPDDSDVVDIAELLKQER